MRSDHVLCDPLFSYRYFIGLFQDELVSIIQTLKYYNLIENLHFSELVIRLQFFWELLLQNSVIASQFYGYSTLIFLIMLIHCIISVKAVIL